MNLLLLGIPPSKLRSLTRGLCACAVIWLTTGLAPAQTLTWRGADGANMSLASNWDPAQAPAAGSQLTFIANASGNAVQDQTLGLAVAGLVFNNSRTITGSEMTVSTIVSNVADANTPARVNLDLVLRSGAQVSSVADGLLVIGESCWVDEPTGAPVICTAQIRTLQIDGAAAVTFSGAGRIHMGSVIVGTGSVNVTGSNVSFDNDQLYTGETLVSGLLRLYKDLNSPIIVQNGGTLTGLGLAREGVTLRGGAQLDPGFRTRRRGAAFDVNGDLLIQTTAGNTATLAFDLDLPQGSNDTIGVSGSLRSLNPAGRVTVELRNENPLTPGRSFILVDTNSTFLAGNNTGPNRITFYHPNGDEIVSGQQFLFGGAVVSIDWDNSRMRLLVEDDLSNSLGTANWGGTSNPFSDRWSQLPNWASNDVPIAQGLAGRTLVFGTAAAAARRTTVNDLDSQFWALQFTASAYQINPLAGSTARLRLSGGMEALASASGTNTIAQPILLSRAQTFANRSSSLLRIDSPIDLNNYDLTLVLDPANAAASPRIALNGPISGNGALIIQQTRAGAAANTSLTFGGSNRDNSFTGPTRIDSGTVFLNARTGAPDNEAFAALSSTEVDVGPRFGVSTSAIVTALYNDQFNNNADVFVNTGSQLNLMTETLRRLSLTSSTVTASRLRISDDLTVQGACRLTATALIWDNPLPIHSVSVSSGGVFTSIAPLTALTTALPLVVYKTGPGTWDQTGLNSGTIRVDEGTLITRGTYAAQTKVKLNNRNALLRGSNLIHEIEIARAGGTIQPGTSETPAQPLRTDYFLGHPAGIYKPSVFSPTSSSLLSIEFFADLGNTRLDVQFTALPAIGSRTKVLLFPTGANWQGSLLSTPQGITLADQTFFTAWGATWKITYPPSTGLQTTNTAVTLERVSPALLAPFKVQNFTINKSEKDPTHLLMTIIASSTPSNSGVTMIIESSRDLIHWTALPSTSPVVANAAGTINEAFEDVNTTGTCFYRLATP